MSLGDVFVGVPQSQYAGLAILVALAFIAIAVLFGERTVPVGYRLLGILMIILLSLPSILLNLLNITCVVTGTGKGAEKWWCGFWGWVLSVFIIFYSAMVVIAAVMVITSKEQLLQESKQAVDLQVANQLAEHFFVEEKKQQKTDIAPVAPTAPKAEETFEDWSAKSLAPLPAGVEDFDCGAPY